ncbi:ribulose-phosphate 3 epimerase family protein [Ostertagia ostertagi]
MLILAPIPRIGISWLILAVVTPMAAHEQSNSVVGTGKPLTGKKVVMPQVFITHRQDPPKPKMKVGLGLLNSKTSNLKSPSQFADKIDMALIMTVEPGFGGCTKIHVINDDKVTVSVKKIWLYFPNKKDCMESFFRSATLKESLRLHRQAFQVDGGVSASNIQIPAEAGANVIVSGTGVVKAPCQKTAITQLREAVQAAITKGY